jgi:ABC-2 type transport system permease protein
MRSPIRAIRIAAHLARASVLTQMQYRWDFIIQILMAAFWVVWNVAPVVLIFEIRPEIAGFRLPEAMLVISAFLILRALLEGVVNPNLHAVVEHIRKGTLDFVLLKPADSQLLVSTSRLIPSKVVDLLAGVALTAWSIDGIEPAPPPQAIAAGAIMLVAGATLLYCVWMLVLCTAFWFVRIDNLSHLFTSIFDAARWPISIFRGWMRLALTFVIPVAFMTSYPALAVLGRLDMQAGLTSIGVAFVFLVVTRRAWRYAVCHYSSASS